MAWVYKVESEHAEHLDHLKHENDGHLPDVPAYPYLNKREKPFPWGMNSLFYNPHVCGENVDLTCNSEFIL
jgi:cytochrome c oxidase subunit 6a